MATKKTKSKTTKTKVGSSALDFCREYLKKDPTAPFADIRDAAAKKGLVLYPISFGRAKALEGLVAMKPRGSKKAAAPAKRGPGRPKGSKNKVKAARSSGDVGGLDDLVSVLRSLQKERDDAVKVLDRIRELVS
jgi:hypothetical protein